MDFKNFIIFTLTLFIFSYAVGNLTIAANKIEGKFVCTIEHNKVLGLKEGRVIVDSTLGNFDDRQLTIYYDLIPIQTNDQTWLFNIRLKGNDFDRFYTIPVAQKIIINGETSLKDSRELIVADNLNTRARLTLSDNAVQFVDKNFFIVMQRYYKNDWEGLSTEFNVNNQGIYKIALAFECRNQLDRIKQMIDTIMVSYE